MVRRSTAIALLALGLSVILHLSGLNVTTQRTLERAAALPPTQDTSIGTAFEDIANDVTEAVQPDVAPAPEPEPETPPDPETAEVPTSRALVASDNPQQTFAPDTGASPASRPDRSGPVTPDVGTSPTPDVTSPSVGAEAAVADARLTPPVGADDVTDLPEGASPETEAEDAPAPEQFAALPAPVPPVVPAPSPNLEPEAPALQEPVASPLPQVVETPDAEASGTGLTASLRPRLPDRRPETATLGVTSSTSDATTPRLAPTELIESPLAAYRRDGTDLFAGRSGGRQSGGSGFSNSSGPGNSNVTNYAGRVLVHLNNAQPVAVSARGWARVFFVIAPDGSLASVDIIDSSGSSELDRAARAHVRAAAPFPIPPRGRNRTLNFVYRNR